MNDKKKQYPTMRRLAAARSEGGVRFTAFKAERQGGVAGKAETTLHGRLWLHGD